MTTDRGARCAWCGDRVPTGDGRHAADPAGERVAAFCRLEHIVPWASQGAHWEAGTLGEHLAPEEPPSSCSFCQAPVGDAHVLLFERRGEIRVADAFCSPAHLEQWARAGGRGR